MLECDSNVFDMLSTKEAQRKLILSFEFPWTPKLETEVFNVLANENTSGRSWGFLKELRRDYQDELFLQDFI